MIHIEPTLELLGKPNRMLTIRALKRTQDQFPAIRCIGLYGIVLVVNKGGTAETRPFRPLFTGQKGLFLFFTGGIIMDKKLTYTFIGAGSMAEAMVAGMINSKLFDREQLIVTNRSNVERLQYYKQQYGVKGTNNLKDALEIADVVILAMKPKDVTAALESIKPYLTEKKLIISVIAGISTKSIEELLGLKIPIIRAMPNTSATIGQSATAISQGTFANHNHEAIAKRLFLTIGTVSIVDEDDLHAVTGLSGSGPAYVYYLVEAMEKAALDLGLDKDVSKELILQTIIGAAEMLKSSPKHPSVLRKEIMSPGGTTEAGLSVLEQYKYQEAMVQCIKRATERSKELGAEIENIMMKQ